MLSIPDQSSSISVSGLDSVVRCISEPTAEISSEHANHLIKEFLASEDSFTLTPDVLVSQEVCSTTKYVALQALFNIVVRKWEVFDESTKMSIKGFLLQNVVVENNGNLEHGNVVKALKIIVQILVLEWPSQWTDFFDTIIGIAQQSVWSTKTCFLLLSLFFEEILDQSKHSLTSIRAHEMKTAVVEIAPPLFDCIMNIFSSCTDTSVIKVVLDALSHLVKFVDPTQLTESPIICQQLPELIKNVELTIPSITVLTEIINSLSGKGCEESIVELFSCVITSLVDVIGESFNEAPEAAQNAFFQLSLVNSISVFTSNISISELDESFVPILQKALQWVLQLTNSDNESICFSCIDFWLNSIQAAFLPQDISGHPPIDIFMPYINDILTVILQKIGAPFTFSYIMDSVNQTHIKVELSHKSSPLTEKMRQCLVLLTNVSMASIKQLLSTIVSELSGETDPNNVLSLCSVIGAVAGQMVEAQENDFLFETIGALLTLAQANSEMIEAVVQGLSFVCGQYSACLQRFPPVLYEITKKLFEFLSVCQEETQLSVLDTLPFIFNKCAQQLISESVPGICSFIDFLGENFVTFLDSLPFDAKLLMFEDVLLLIQKPSDFPSQMRYFQPILDYLNSLWTELTSNMNPKDLEFNNNLLLVLKYHSLIPKYIKTPYNNFLLEFVPNLVELYKLFVAEESQESNEEIFMSMKLVSSQIVAIFTKSVQYCYTEDTIMNTIYLPAFQPLLEDFANVPFFEAEMLRLATQLVVKIPSTMKDAFPNVFHKLMLPMMDKITAEVRDCLEESEYLRPFFELVVNIMIKNSACILSLGEEAPVFIDIAKMGCECNSEVIYTHCFEAFAFLFSNKDPGVLELTQSVAIDVIKYTFNVLTSLDKKAAFDSQVFLIRTLIGSPVVQEGVEQLLQFIYENYPTLGVQGTKELFEEMLSSQSDSKAFRVLMKNFLVNIRSISPDDPDLKKEERRQAEQEIIEMYKSVAGFIPPDPSDDNEALHSLANQISTITIN